MSKLPTVTDADIERQRRIMARGFNMTQEEKERAGMEPPEWFVDACREHDFLRALRDERYDSAFKYLYLVILNLENKIKKRHCE